MSVIVGVFGKAAMASTLFTKQEVDALTRFHGEMVCRSLLTDYAMTQSTEMPSFYRGVRNVGGVHFSSVTLVKILSSQRNEYVVENNDCEAYRALGFDQALGFMYEQYNKVVVPEPKRKPALSIVPTITPPV